MLHSAMNDAVGEGLDAWTLIIYGSLAFSLIGGLVAVLWFYNVAGGPQK